MERGCKGDEAHANKFVMPGLVPGIHVVTARAEQKTWMAGTSPAMTIIPGDTGRS
jgi:hypothetical protein